VVSWRTGVKRAELGREATIGVDQVPRAASEHRRAIRLIVVEEALAWPDWSTIITGPEVCEAIQVLDEVTKTPACRQLDVGGNERTLVLENYLTDGRSEGVLTVSPQCCQVLRTCITDYGPGCVEAPRGSKERQIASIRDVIRKRSELDVLI
jgi:hypothetical protein